MAKHPQNKKKGSFILHLGSDGERDKQIINQIHLLYTLEHVNNLRGESRFIDINLSTKKAHVQFKKRHTQMSPLPPAGLENSELQQRRRRPQQKGKKNQAISEFPWASVLKRG